MEMGRREVLVNGLKTLGAAGLLAQIGSLRLAQAQALEGSEKTIVVKNSIAKNHGHGFELSLVDLVLLLRDATANGNVLLNIQGTSGHAHELLLTSEGLIKLLIEGKVEQESSKDVGHTHLVSISLEVVDPTGPAEPAV